MPVKHDAVESSASRRPLAQKLSGLIIRRGGPGKGGPKSPEIIDEKASIFRFKRQKKAPSPEATPEFKPLEVDLNRLSLSEGWLDTHKDEELEQRQDEHKLLQQQQEQQNSSDNTDDSTPIANKYSTMLSLGVQDQGKIDWPYLQKQDSNSNKRPYSMVETSSLAYRRPLQSSSAQSVGSVLDRGRPVEPKRYVTDPLWKTNAILPDPPAQSAPVVEKATTSRHVPRKSIQSIHNDTNALSATTKHNIAAAPQAKAPEKLDRVGRHSMYATPNPTAALPALKPVATPSSRSSSANPLDRIQQWQKSVTSAPSSNPGAPAANPTSAPSSNAPSRKASTTTRGVGNRLAWIKELEEKKSGSLGQDIGVLKKASGSVSNRLAMFESKQAAAAPPLSNKKPPLTRTNSTTSRLSSVGLDSTFSANGNTTATPRTSGETVRSSHRASSVMSYYDDSFREKMENVAGSYSDAKDKEKEKESKPEKAGLQRVKTSFLSVDPKKKAESATSESDANETEAKEEIKSAEPVTAIEQPESKTEEEPQTSQSISPVVETAKPEEEPQTSQSISPVVETTKPEEEIKSAEPAVAEVKTSEEPKAEPQPVEAAAVEKAEEKSESS